MIYQERYGRAVNASNLIDDATHDNCAPLGASGWAGRYMSALGALLLRAKVADGTASMLFESGARNLASILALWLPLVREKGRSRKWRREVTDRDITSAEALYVRVAESSLAYWLDDRCNECEGATVDHDRRTCQRCGGSGKEKLLMPEYEKNIALDLKNELEYIMQSHARRANYALRE